MHLPLLLCLPSCDPEAWEIIFGFATNDEMTLPEAESKLRKHLGLRFVQDDWQPALNAVVNAEGDTLTALDALESLRKRAIQSNTHLVIKITPLPKPPQLLEAERGLARAVRELEERRRIIGDPPSLNELIQPPEEEVEDEDNRPENDEEFIASVDRDVAAELGAVEEEDSDSDDEPREAEMCHAEVMELCKKLERACLDRIGEVDNVQALSKEVRRFRGQLQRSQSANARQTTLETFWKPSHVTRVTRV